MLRVRIRKRLRVFGGRRIENATGILTPQSGRTLLSVNSSVSVSRVFVFLAIFGFIYVKMSIDDDLLNLLNRWEVEAEYIENFKRKYLPSAIHVVWRLCREFAILFFQSNF